MPLPELKTSKEIRDEIITDIESQIGQNTPILYKAFNRVIAGALSLTMTALYKLGQWGYKQIFTVTQGEEALKLKQEQYGIPSKPAQASQLGTYATGANGVIIPAGQTFRGDINGLVYAVQTSVELASGFALPLLTCLTAGEAGNLLVNDTLTIAQPISGLDNSIFVTHTVVEGADAETIEELRARVSVREKLPPQGGSLLDYISWALEVEGITRAFVYGRRDWATVPLGEVYVYPLNDGETSRIPSGAKLLEVESYIDFPSRAPTQCVAIHALAMDELDVDVTIDDLVPDTADIRTAITTNITAWLLAREPQQFLDQTDIKNVVSRSLMEGIATDSGATSLTLTFDVSASPEETYTLDKDELVYLASINWI